MKLLKLLPPSVLPPPSRRLAFPRFLAWLARFTSRSEENIMHHGKRGKDLSEL